MLRRHAGTLCTAVAALVMLAVLAIPADAVELAIPDARAKAKVFATSTCSHDKQCIRSGVLNCRRHSAHIGFCRIFLKRHTKVQGRYVCHRLVRLAIKPKTHRIPVTGLGRWHCS